MKNIKLPTGEYLLVEVPEDANNFEMYPNNIIGGWCIMYLLGEPDYHCGYSPNIPPGQWKIIGRASELTENSWEAIVEWWTLDKETGYRNYEFQNDFRFLLTPSESGLSLIKSHSMNPSTTLILKIK